MELVCGTITAITKRILDLGVNLTAYFSYHLSYNSWKTLGLFISYLKAIQFLKFLDQFDRITELYKSYRNYILRYRWD